MYNLTVAEAHTYFVGQGQWLVHNACWTVGAHKNMPTPRGNYESHHGMMSKWMKIQYSNYNQGNAPAILLPKANHNATRGYYNTWQAQMRKQMGGVFDWNKVSESQMRTLAEGMFDAAKVPKPIRDEYWKQFDIFVKELQ